MGEFVGGELVAFCADDEETALMGAEEGEELGIAFLRRDVGVDEADAERECGAIGEVGVDEFWPLGGDGFGDLRVAVAGQVSEDEARWRVVGGGFCVGEEREEVDGAGAAGRGGDFCLAGADEGVEQRRLADVGAAEEGYFWRGWSGKLCGVEGGEKKFWCEHQRLAGAVAAGLAARSSARISTAARRARSALSGGKEIAPTRAWPPPPYRSQMVARFTIFSAGTLVHGLEPTATLVRKLERLRPTE